jgi:hypothetical protein
MNEKKLVILTRSRKVVNYLSARYFDEMPVRSDGGEILYHEYGTQLRRTSIGEYVLNVLCGRVGQYGVEIVLSPEEVETYRSRNGDIFIHNLGEDIYDNPDAFQKRIVRRC